MFDWSGMAVILVTIYVVSNNNDNAELHILNNPMRWPSWILHVFSGVSRVKLYNHLANHNLYAVDKKHLQLDSSVFLLVAC